MAFNKGRFVYRFLSLGMGLVLALAAGRQIGLEAEPYGEIQEKSLEELLEDLAAKPSSPYSWCALAEVYHTAGDEKAGYCLVKAVEYGPNAAPILMRAANLQFLNNQVADALGLSARVIKLTPEYDRMVFRLYDQLVPDIKAILSEIGENDRASLSYFRHLLGQRRVEDGMLAWKILYQDTRRAERPVGPYIDFLIQASHARQASEVWRAELGANAAGYPSRNAVFNPGFESEPRKVAFDWNLSSPAGVTAAIDSSGARSGRRALGIEFSGKNNIQFNHAGQAVYAPAGRYRIRAWMKTEGITTDQGVLLRLRAAQGTGDILFESEMLTGTNDWTAVEGVVATGGALLRLEVVRNASRKFDNKIRGRVWVDDVALEPVN